MPEDQRLAYEVERALGMLPGVNLRNVRARVTDGRAVITGIVVTETEKQAILRAAERVPGISGVEEAIAVEDPGTAHSVHVEGAMEAGEELAR